jgi:hypothetical protein
MGSKEIEGDAGDEGRVEELLNLVRARRVT